MNLDFDSGLSMNRSESKVWDQSLLLNILSITSTSYLLTVFVITLIPSLAVLRMGATLEGLERGYNGSVCSTRRQSAAVDKTEPTRQKLKLEFLNSINAMFSPFKDHFNLDHDVTASNDVVNLGNIFVILMVGNRTKQQTRPKADKVYPKDWFKYSL